MEISLEADHLQRAMQLLQQRPRGERGNRARISGAFDRVALKVMSRAFRSQHRAAVAEKTLPLDHEWQLWRQRAREPAVLIAKPRAIPAMSVRLRRPLEGGTVEDISFASYHAPTRPSAIELTRRFPENATAHFRVYRHTDKPRPAVVCLHGWGGGSYRMEARVFRAEWLYQLGLDVYLYVQPYHGPRRPAAADSRTPMHPSTDVVRTNEAFLQSIWELRSIAAYHQQRSDHGIGVIGYSLGGYLSSLVASVAPEFSFAIPMLPIADFSALIWKFGERTKERQFAQARGIDFESFCSAMAIHSPLAYRLALPRERVMIIAGQGDRIAPPAHANALWEHWREPSIHWFPGGHLLHFGRDQYMNDVSRFLRSIGVI